MGSLLTMMRTVYDFNNMMSSIYKQHHLYSHHQLQKTLLFNRIAWKAEETVLEYEYSTLYSK